MTQAAGDMPRATWLARAASGLLRMARRFPVSLFCILAPTALFPLLLLLDAFGSPLSGQSDTEQRLIFLAVLGGWAFGLPASLAAVLFAEARGWRKQDRHLLSAAALLPTTLLAHAQAQAVPAAIGFALLAFLAPVMGRPMARSDAWAFTRGVLRSLGAALLAGIPAYVLLAAGILHNIVSDGFNGLILEIFALPAAIWLAIVPWMVFLARLPDPSTFPAAPPEDGPREGGSRWRKLGFVSVALLSLLALGAVFAMAAIMAVPLTEEFIFPDRIVILYFAGLVAAWLGTSCLWLARGGRKSPSRAIAVLALLLIAGSVGPWSAKAMEYRVAMRQLISLLQTSGHMVGGRLIETGHPDTLDHVDQHGNIRTLAILTYHSDYRERFVQWFVQAGGDEFAPDEWPHTRADNEILYIVDVLGPFQ